jgi:N-acylglucosamine 2-epimerase
MDRYIRQLSIGFYENELCNNILPFWLKRCEDKENGGYFNCFSNDGSQLVSKNKYTWSEGRFLWLFSKLATMDRPFPNSQRERFLKLAKSGRDFLVKHSIMDREPMRCVFLMDEYGNPLHMEGFEPLDMSIYADGFVMGGLCRYSTAANDRESYEIARKLYQSIMHRYMTFQYRTLPYPISPEYVMHGFYMSRILHSYDISLASQVFDPEYAKETKAKLRESMDLLLNRFVDEDDNLREVIYRESGRGLVPGIFGNHSNPGHICEEMWIIQHAADMINDPSYTARCVRILKKALAHGWDPEYGGLYHFCALEGGEPLAGENDPVDEVIYQQLISGWADKLWWVHSEALYSTMLFAERTADEELKDWYKRVFDYTFRHYPNPDREIREWIQILSCEGRPQSKVTGLPVKDPFHITRNLIYILQLLYAAE